LPFGNSVLFNCAYSTLVIKQTDMLRKMILHAHEYCNMLIHDDPLLEGSINNIKNTDKYEKEDEDDDINIDALDVTD